MAKGMVDALDTAAARMLQARRYAGLSQTALAAAIGVHRSAVNHWESARNKLPSSAHLRDVAIATQVNYEWLATGRGAMALLESTRLDSIRTADAVVVYDALELRLLIAFRNSTFAARTALEVAEQLPLQRLGRKRKADPGHVA